MTEEKRKSEEEILSSENWKNRNDSYYKADPARIKAYEKAVEIYKESMYQVLRPETAQFYIVAIKNAIVRLENMCDQADKIWSEEYNVANQT